MPDKLRVGSLFAGIGGLELGLEWTGHFETVWQVELDEFARKILAKHWPEVPRHDDVCTFPPSGFDWSCDVITGGFPCQDISYAGKGAGLDGKRSGLFFELARVVREVGPRYLLLENVSALLNRGMGDVVGTLASLGYDCQWHCIPAAAVGAPHRRDRVFILADADSLKRQRSRQEPFSDQSDLSRQLRRSCSRLSEQWAVEPELGRVANGISFRVDRLRCLGNAVVPQVAQVVGEILWSIHNGKHEPQQREARRA